MRYREYLDILRCDRERYGMGKTHLELYLFNPCYRISTRYRKIKYYSSHRLLRGIYYFERFLYNLTCTKYGCDIPSHVEIGPGFRMDHPVGVIINSKSKIGNNFTIKSGAVIGANTKGGVPVIGDNVSVGVHALLIGGIKVGNNAKIGAGAIVTHDVPEGAIMVCDYAHEL